MTHMIVSIVVMTVAVYLAALLVPGFKIKGWGTALGVAAVYGVLNALMYKPVFFLTFPLAVLTLGLVVNMLLLWVTSKIVPNVEFSGIIPLGVSALAIAVLRWLLFVIFT